MNNITPEQALAILDAGTAPQNAGKLSRQDYVNIQTALIVLDGVVKELSALKEEKSKKSAEPENKK